MAHKFHLVKRLGFVRLGLTLLLTRFLELSRRVGLCAFIIGSFWRECDGTCVDHWLCYWIAQQVSCPIWPAKAAADSL